MVLKDVTCLGLRDTSVGLSEYITIIKLDYTAEYK